MKFRDFKELREDKNAGAIGFVIAMLILGMVVSALVGTFAYNIAQAQANASVIAIPGGVAMLGLLGLLFMSYCYKQNIMKFSRNCYSSSHICKDSNLRRQTI